MDEFDKQQGRSYSTEILNSIKNWQFIVPFDLVIWQMTLKKQKGTLTMVL